jgi:hypothetical protein
MATHPNRNDAPSTRHLILDKEHIASFQHAGFGPSAKANKAAQCRSIAPWTKSILGGRLFTAPNNQQKSSICYRFLLSLVKSKGKSVLVAERDARF